MEGVTTVATCWSLYQELPLLISKSHHSCAQTTLTPERMLTGCKKKSKHFMQSVAPQVQICQTPLTSIQPSLGPQGLSFIPPVHHFLMAEVLVQHPVPYLEASRSPVSLEKPCLVSKETSVLGFCNSLLRWAPRGSDTV
jgi:hypothetical protein